MSQDAVKLIGECSRERLPPYIEQLILDVKTELNDSVTDHDLTMVLLFGLMTETGFMPLAVDDKLSGPVSPNYSVDTLKAVRKLPKDWRSAGDSQYSIKFYLNTCNDAICQLRARKLETKAISDSLIVNLFANCSPTAFVLHVKPSRYVTSKNAEIENMFDNLDELSLLFKNVIHPLRNGILEKFGQLNASLSGMPTEVKLKIFSYLSVPNDWKALSQTCIDMHILGEDPQLWKLYLQRDFGSVFPHKESVEMLCRSTEDVDWKTEYMGRFTVDATKKKMLRSIALRGRTGGSDESFTSYPSFHSANDYDDMFM